MRGNATDGNPRLVYKSTPDVHESGLGEFVKQVTASMGIQPCDSCNRRAEKLNRLVNWRKRS